MISALLKTLALLAAPATPLDQIMAERLERAVLDPGGGRIALVVNGSSGATLRVASLGQQEPRQEETLLWSATGQIPEIAWLSDNALLAIEQDRTMIRWWTVEADTGKARQVFSHDAGQSGGRGPRLLALIRPQGALMSLDRRRPWEPDVYRIDLSDGSLDIEQANPGQVFQWWVDPRGRVQAGRGWSWENRALNYHILVPQPDGQRWQIRGSHRLDQPVIRPVGFSRDAQYLYLAAETAPLRRQLSRLDLATLKRDPQWKVDLDAGAVSALGHDPDSGLPAWVAYESASLPGRQGLQPGWNGMPPGLNRHGGSRRLAYLGSAGGTQLWFSSSDRSPGEYHVIPDGQPSVVLPSSPGASSGFSMEPIKFPARDGHTVTGYLTRSGPDAGPLVLKIHGGPWSRDLWGWDAETQFLAGLGFHVLQVNYRGSYGLGVSWLQAGRRQWGRAMQNDLEDAVDWALEQGLAGPVCAVGSSYGGYAALMMMVGSDVPVRCAVARSPVTDLPAQIRSIRRRGDLRGYYEWVDMVGDPRTQDLEQVSPLHRADEIRGGVLLAHGTRDAVVAFEQSRDLAQALAGGEADVTWLPLHGQGHDLVSPMVKENYYRTLARFLGQQLRPGGGISDRNDDSGRR